MHFLKKILWLTFSCCLNSFSWDLISYLIKHFCCRVNWEKFTPPNSSSGGTGTQNLGFGLSYLVKFGKRWQKSLVQLASILAIFRLILGIPENRISDRYPTLSTTTPQHHTEIIWIHQNVQETWSLLLLTI